MSVGGPYFQAWCHENDTASAFLNALSALRYPEGRCIVEVDYLRPVKEDAWRPQLPLEEAIRSVPTRFTHQMILRSSLATIHNAAGHVWLDVTCYGEEYVRRHPQAPLEAGVGDCVDFFLRSIDIAVGHGSGETYVQAAISATDTIADIERILLGFCAPDASKRVVAGAASHFGRWEPSLEMAATYHADGRVARDVALSWISRHDNLRVDTCAGMSMEALRARVEAAPYGARIHVAQCLRKERHEIWFELALMGRAEITREQVLAVLDTPPATLLDALEAAAVPDEDWRAVELMALECIEAKKQGAPTMEVNVYTGHHRRFIENHAPYHVRRLPNGGVLLATHPYRTLWQLWADALALLGIRP
jgi:hypothetical protein